MPKKASQSVDIKSQQKMLMISTPAQVSISPIFYWNLFFLRWCFSQLSRTVSLCLQFFGKRESMKKPTDLMNLTTGVNFTNQFPQSANAPVQSACNIIKWANQFY
jgi:hypothetical protein